MDATQLFEKLNKTWSMPGYYQLIPVQSWTWLVKAPPDPAAPPLYVEWDPAALPPDDGAYWTWDGEVVALMQWSMGAWRDLQGTSFAFLHDPHRFVLAWQPLSAPPGPVPRKDPV